jgi:hypothetical protein
MVMDEYYVGKRKTIWLCPGAEVTWDAAEQLVPSNKKSCLAQFRARIKYFADSGQLISPDHMNSEGEGCFVIKATCGLRAWGWMQHVEGNAAFVISHVVLKKKGKADPADLKKTIAARKEVEENTR